ncbi:MAG: tetratricopeptide repeat protein [Pseudomonadota bacterium]|jgi:cytochrome c-type biogenesis protein CcmH/NrfG
MSANWRAAEHRRRATQDHPQAADAWNNLAQVLLEQGRTGEARQAAQRAVRLGGARFRTYRETLEAIPRAAKGG